MNVIHIARRELSATMSSSVGWLVLAGYLFLTGFFWLYMVSNYVVQSQDLVFNPYAASMLSLTDYLLVPFFGNCAVVLLFVAPALTMRLFAEEQKQRTMELLLTSPCSTFEIVLGKYLGALAWGGLLLASTLHYPLMLSSWGDPDPGAIAAAYLALFLLLAAVQAMGMLFSSLTSSQVVALVLSFSGSLALYVLDWGSDSPDDWQAKLAVGTHLVQMMQGEIRVSDVAYFVLLSLFCIAATHQRVESYRWS